MRGGYVVDTCNRTVGFQGGDSYPLDRLEIAGGRLFYARAIAGSALVSLQETWLIPDRDWTFTRFTFHEHLRAAAFDWKLEPDHTEPGERFWRVSDGYLDLVIYEGSRYELEDADELADALATGAISLAEGLRALHATNTLCKALKDHGNSGLSLLREYAPELAP